MWSEYELITIRPLNVADLMTRDVVTVGPQTPLKDVARLLVERGISAVPVVGIGDALLGVVSEADILWKEKSEPPRRSLDWLLPSTHDHSKQEAGTAGEAMTTPAITIAPDSAVADAARVMIDRNVKRLLVVKNGRLVGVVSRSDLVRAFARSDDEIEREILHDVVVRTHWITPSAVEVRVNNGRVVLRGYVESKPLADSVRHFVARVPGVVDVESHLTWPHVAANAP
jgi:CBS domain-containing protein